MEDRERLDGGENMPMLVHGVACWYMSYRRTWNRSARKRVEEENRAVL